MRKFFTAALLLMGALSVVSCGTQRRAQNQYPNNGYQPQQGNYQYAQQGIYNGQMPPQYQQQYQSQAGPDNDGFSEVKKSPIEELSMAQGTNEIRAYGTATSKNEQLALNAARATATAALQEKIEVYVKAGLDRYIHETNDGIDELTRNQIVTAAKGVVNGASVLDSRKLYNSNTKEYKYEVCVTYDKAGVIGVMQAQSDRIRANEKQFEKDMQAAWDELDAHNGRVSLGEQQQMRQNEIQQQNMDRQHQRDMQMQQQQSQYPTQAIQQR